MEKPISLSAMISAFYRAHHVAHDEPRIFEDTLARALFTDTAYADLGHNLALSLPVFVPERATNCPDEETALELVTRAQGGPVVLSRARYTEDCLEAAVREGVRQYVILGAGMDTFAYRAAPWKGGLRVFEVDQPAMQAYKRQRVEELGWAAATELEYVPVDFATETLGPALDRSSYDARVPGFFSWLGVTYYLEPDIVRGMLRAIAQLAPSGSSILFDYLDTDAFDMEKASPGLKTLHQVMRHTGEPLKTGFDPRSLDTELRELGWSLKETLSPEGIQARFFEGRTDGYRALPHYHFAWAEVV